MLFPSCERLSQVKSASCASSGFLLAPASCGQQIRFPGVQVAFLLPQSFLNEQPGVRQCTRRKAGEEVVNMEASEVRPEEGLDAPEPSQQRRGQGRQGGEPLSKQRLIHWRKHAAYLYTFNTRR